MVRFFRIILFLLIFLFLRSLIRSILAAARNTGLEKSPSQPPSVPASGELKKDPVCGTYVSIAGSLSERVHGETVYFCSKECRDKFRAA
jgi:YHS domain-containing protein